MPLFAAAAHDDVESPPAFVDVDEVPDSLLDHDPKADNAHLIEEEGDDSVHADTEGGEYRPPVKARRAESPIPVKARARVVPLRREIKRGTVGKDVLALKRALSHAGYLKWTPTKWSYVMGPVALSALNRFKKQHGLKANSVYGIKAHRKLVQFGYFDKYGARLMAQAPRPRKHPNRKHLAVADQIEAYCLWAYHHRDQISYLQRRPMHIYNLYGLPQDEDCSEFATKSFKAGGAPDPNGEFYNGTGWTGTLTQHGTRGPWSTAALNFYGGSFPYKHVTVGAGKSRCFSMGSDPGPLLEGVAYRPDYSHTHVYKLTK